MCVCLQRYFDAHATVIQKCWRGHFSRNHIHDFYKRKAFLQSVAAANAAVKADMEAELQAALSIRQQEAQAAAKHTFDMQVRRGRCLQHRGRHWLSRLQAVQHRSLHCSRKHRSLAHD